MRYVYTYGYMNTFGTVITVTIASFYLFFLLMWGTVALLPGVLPTEFADIVRYRGTTTALFAAVGSLGILSLYKRYRASLVVWAVYYPVLFSIGIFMIVMSDLGTLGCANACEGQGVSEQTANVLSSIRILFIGGLPLISMILVLAFGLKRTESTQQ